MSYEVLIDNLRAAGTRYRSVATSLGTDGPELTKVEPDSVGHIELAAWIKAVAEQCDNATQALHDGADGLADSLDTAAHHYQTTDETIGSVFQSPLTGGGLLDPSSPFGTFGNGTTFGNGPFGTGAGTTGGPR